MKHLIVVIAAFFSFLSYSYAQLDASVALSPAQPSPHSPITITLTSSSFDVNLAMITWKKGNTTLLSGMGAKKLVITMGDPGVSVPITFIATTEEGGRVEGSVTLTPQSVDLVYQAIESYVPPFYEGLALPGEGANVRLTAIPTFIENGKVIPVSSLSFNWYVSGDYIEGASGTGKASAVFALDYLSDSTEIRVMVRSGRGIVAEKTISVRPHKVMPTLYSYDEVLGTNYTQAFSRRLELSQDIVLSLEPYFLSSKKGTAGYDSYSWYLDGLPVTPQERTLLALRPNPNAYGVRTLSIVVENTKRKLQEAQETIEIIFDTRQ